MPLLKTTTTTAIRLRKFVEEIPAVELLNDDYDITA